MALISLASFSAWARPSRKTSTVRQEAQRSTTWPAISGQMLLFGSTRRSSTALVTWMAAFFSCLGATTAAFSGQARASAVKESGVMVADSPTRCTRRPQRASSRAREKKRCAPRLVLNRACSSSMMTERTVESRRRPPLELSSRNSDSGVVISRWGGWRSMRCLSAAGVSPVRTATRSSGPPMPSKGRLRFSRMSLPRALRGEMYSSCSASASSPRAAWALRWSINTRKAARVLPVPVGALIRVCSPARMWGQPWAWASVGSPRACSNQAAVAW